jgi:hypothetical protein
VRHGFFFCNVLFYNIHEESSFKWDQNRATQYRISILLTPHFNYLLPIVLFEKHSSMKHKSGQQNIAHLDQGLRSIGPILALFEIRTRTR